MATNTAPVLNVQFTNNSNYADSEVYIGFVSGSDTAAFNITNAADNSVIDRLNTAAGPGNWYLLSNLGSGVNVVNFSGRVYVAYVQAWSVNGPGYEPAQNVTDANFYLRYDKMEMTFNGASSDVADLTSIDYWSIPISLSTSLSGNTVATVTGLNSGVTTQDVYNALNPLTTPPVSGLAGPGGTDGTPIPALVPGEFQQYGKGPQPGTSFARIIGPSSYPPVGAIPVTPYDTFKNYLQYLLDTFGPATKADAVIPGLGAGTVAIIAGSFAGVGPVVPPSGPTSMQAYNLNALIDNDLNITLSGTIANGTTVTSMLYKVADLMNPSGIYGGNAPYYLNGSSTSTDPGNDVYGWIGGDFFAGMNIGAVGSTVLSGAAGSSPVGQLASSQWFALPISSFYDKLQPGTTNYNQWAAALQPLSQAYNFAYTDRFGHVFASLNPATVDTLTITLEDATVTM